MSFNNIDIDIFDARKGHPTLVSKVNEIDKRLDDLEEGQEKINKRLDALESTQDKLISQITIINKNNDAIKVAIEGLGGTITLEELPEVEREEI